VTGWICDERRGQALRDAAPHIPADRLMLRDRRSLPAPAHVAAKTGASAQRARVPAWVLAALAHCRGEDPDALAATTTSNASRFFGLTLAVAAGAPYAMPQLV
jgi:TatD DNase family protein